jgi:septal ring factor EnvC (AmiA/AmiB activator)
MKDAEWSGLMKIPDEVLISELRIKVGQLESYIEELEEQLKEKVIKTVKLSKLEHLEKDNERLKALLMDTRNRLGDLGARNQRLEKELFKHLKQQNEKTD